MAMTPRPPGRSIRATFNAAAAQVYRRVPQGRTNSLPARNGSETFWTSADAPRQLTPGHRSRHGHGQHSLPPFLQTFDTIWGRMREEVNESWDYFRGVDLSKLSLEDLRENLIQARQYHKRAFEIHFQVMYPLLANYVGFYGMCTELGLDQGQIGKFLQGYDTKIMSGPDRVLEAVRQCWASLFNARAVAYRLRSGLDHRDMPMAVGVIELINARASGVAFSAHPVTGKTDRIVIETSWGWGEAVVQGLVTPDHVEVGKADGRILDYQVAAKKVVSNFDYAVGRVVEARPVTVVSAAAEPAPTEWNPAAMAAKYVFKT